MHKLLTYILLYIYSYILHIILAYILKLFFINYQYKAVPLERTKSQFQTIRHGGYVSAARRHIGACSSKFPIILLFSQELYFCTYPAQQLYRLHIQPVWELHRSFQYKLELDFIRTLRMRDFLFCTEMEFLRFSCCR